MSKGTIRNDHPVLQKKYLRQKNGPTCLYFQAEQARWQAEHCHDLSGHYLQVEISKKRFEFLKTRYKHTKMHRHVVLAMDVSVFLLKTIGKPRKIHEE